MVKSTKKNVRSKAKDSQNKRKTYRNILKKYKLTPRNSRNIVAQAMAEGDTHIGKQIENLILSRNKAWKKSLKISSSTVYKRKLLKFMKDRFTYSGSVLTPLFVLTKGNLTKKILDQPEFKDEFGAYIPDSEIIELINTPEKTYRSDISSIEIDQPEFQLHPNIQSILSEKNNTYEDIPIYLFVINHTGHASIVVFSSDGRLYSIGLGTTMGKEDMPIKNRPAHYSVKSVGISLKKSGIPMGSMISLNQAILMTGDILIRPEYDNPRYTWRIVDIGFFTKEHANRIQQYVNKVIHADVSFRPFSSFTLYLNASYSYISNPTIVGTFKSYVNCVGFAQNIFKERVICSNVAGISDPFLCRNKNGNLDEDKVFGIIERYTSNKLTEADIAYLK